MTGPHRALAAALAVACIGASALRDEHVEASTVVKFSVEELSTRCDLACEARVTSKSVTRDAAGRIATDYALAIERTFAGPPAAQRTVRIPGGTLPDGRGLILPGMPTLAIGENALLFLSGENQRGERLPIGLAQGRMRIETPAAGTKRIVTDLADLDFVDASGRPVDAGPRTGVLPYAPTIARIEAACAARPKAVGK